MDHVERILEQWRVERPDLDLSAMGIIGRLKRLSLQVGQSMETVFNAYGLNAASFDVLATLRRSGDPYLLTPSELMAWTMVSSGTMTHRIDRLERAGLVIRRPNPGDGRGFLIGLTERGHALIEQAVKVHCDNQAALIASLSAADVAQLDRLLALWLQAIEEPER